MKNNKIKVNKDIEVKKLSDLFARYLFGRNGSEDLLEDLVNATLSDFNFEEVKDFYKEFSPPPNKLSKNSRMSPAGISYMYLNNDIKTCISEIKSDSGKFLIGKFTNKKELKIINLSKMVKFEIDIFSDNYKNIWINKFIKEFSKEISKKII